jgi:membrane-associated phospholipid phosphatase
MVPMTPRARSPWLAAPVVLLLSARAPAQTRAPAFRLDPSVDIPVLGLSAPVLASWFIAAELRPPYCAPRCDPATVNAFDRVAAGNYNPTVGTVADATTVGIDLLALSAVALAEGFPNAAVDGTVVIESVMVANSMAILMNFAMQRPRPRVYGDAAPLDERTGGLAAMSSFSGHTANAFAATLATFQVLRRVASPGVAYTALGVGLTLSTFVGVSRVVSGSHFPSDVLAGAAVGASVGWLVPALHASPVRVAPMALGTTGGGLSVAGAF